jgi:hypothetical protein
VSEIFSIAGVSSQTIGHEKYVFEPNTTNNTILVFGGTGKPRLRVYAWETAATGAWTP